MGATQTAVYRHNRPRRILTPGRDDTRASRIRWNESVALPWGSDAFRHAGGTTRVEEKPDEGVECQREHFGRLGRRSLEAADNDASSRAGKLR